MDPTQLLNSVQRPLSVSQLRTIQGTGDRASLPVPRQGDSFSEVFTNAIDRVDALQKNAESTMSDFVAGKHDNVHDVVISMNEANLAFQFMTEVRNRLLEGYQELMRMQV